MGKLVLQQNLFRFSNVCEIKLFVGKSAPNVLTSHYFFQDPLPAGRPGAEAPPPALGRGGGRGGGEGGGGGLPGALRRDHRVRPDDPPPAEAGRRGPVRAEATEGGGGGRRREEEEEVLPAAAADEDGPWRRRRGIATHYMYGREVSAVRGGGKGGISDRGFPQTHITSIWDQKVKKK